MNRKLPPHMIRQSYTTKRRYKRTYYYYQFGRKKKQKKIPLGTDYKTALLRYHDLDGRRLKGRPVSYSNVYLSDWTKLYLEAVKDKDSLERDQRSCKILVRELGDPLLIEITRMRIMKYRNDRRAQGRKDSTINRELACLHSMLTLARDEDLIDSVPKFKMESEEKFARHRVVTATEYKDLLEASPRYFQRVLIGYWETAMRKMELLNLVWPKVDLTNRLIRIDWKGTKEKRKKSVPITDPLCEVLWELKAEQKRVGNLKQRVFTRRGHPIKNIKTVWERVRARAKIKDVTTHDFRHTAITRWEEEGKPVGAIMAATGHRTFRQHQRYTNFTEEQVLGVFGLNNNVVRKTGEHTSK